MLLRQVQARPLQGDHLRALRRRGHAPEGAPRADGPHRPRRARLAHLVLQGRAEPHRLPARHRAARAREGPLLRRLDRHRGRPREARGRCRRPRGQGPRRVGADQRRPRRAARRARRAPRAPSCVPLPGQGQGLRRGRRVLGARPVQLGRGPGAAAARRGALDGGRDPARPRKGDHERGPEAPPRARPPGGDARGPATRPARDRVRGNRRGRAPRRARAAAQRPRALVRLEEGRDHEAPSQAA